jgi:SNF family Na+-dependent transporter
VKLGKDIAIVVSAVFFIPYTIMLFFVGMPIFFLELSLGQFTSASPLTCWTMAPFFRGECRYVHLTQRMIGV